MSNTETFELNSELKLHDANEFPVIVYVNLLTLTKTNEEIIKCHITFQVTPELYHYIETEESFNLKPEIRPPFTKSDFQPSPDIQIEASLKPDLLPLILEHVTGAANTNEL